MEVILNHLKKEEVEVHLGVEAMKVEKEDLMLEEEAILTSKKEAVEVYLIRREVVVKYCLAWIETFLLKLEEAVNLLNNWLTD